MTIIIALSVVLGVFAYGLVFSPLSDLRKDISKDVLILIVGGFLGFLTKATTDNFPKLGSDKPDDTKEPK